MKKKTIARIIVAIIAISILGTSTLAAFAKENTPEIIIDTDISDSDDLIAIRMAEKFETEGTYDLKAVMSCLSGGDSAIGSLLTSDGFKTTPVGICDKNPHENLYWDILTSNPDKTIKENSVRLYRRILDSSKSKVDIITIGHLTNISDLLKSEPDDISDLSGIELIKDKCSGLHITGGSLVDGKDNNTCYDDSVFEESCHVFDNWPNEIPLILYHNRLGNTVTAGQKIKPGDVVYSCLEKMNRNDVGGPGWDAFNLLCFHWLKTGENIKNGISLKKINIGRGDGSHPIEISEIGTRLLAVKEPGRDTEYTKIIQNYY